MLDEALPSKFMGWHGPYWWASTIRPHEFSIRCLLVLTSAFSFSVLYTLRLSCYRVDSRYIILLKAFIGPFLLKLFKTFIIFYFDIETALLLLFKWGGVNFNCIGNTIFLEFSGLSRF